MTRKTFLTIFSFIGLGIGTFALVFPAVVLEMKGTAPSEVANVWVTEVGILLISVGIITFLVRGHEDSSTLKAFLIGNLILQAGLFPIEIIAYANGVITKLSGIIPNSILHIVLALGFVYYLVKMKNTKL